MAPDVRWDGMWWIEDVDLGNETMTLMSSQNKKIDGVRWRDFKNIYENYKIIDRTRDIDVLEKLTELQELYDAQTRNYSKSILTERDARKIDFTLWKVESHNLNTIILQNVASPDIKYTITYHDFWCVLDDVSRKHLLDDLEQTRLDDIKAKRQPSNIDLTVKPQSPYTPQKEFVDLLQQYYITADEDTRVRLAKRIAGSDYFFDTYSNPDSYSSSKRHRPPTSQIILEHTLLTNQ